MRFDIDIAGVQIHIFCAGRFFSQHKTCGRDSFHHRIGSFSESTIFICVYCDSVFAGGNISLKSCVIADGESRTSERTAISTLLGDANTMLRKNGERYRPSH